MSATRRKRQIKSAEVTIESLNYDGRGVSHIDEHVIFIDGALPGERVAIEYKKKRRNIYEGRVLSVLQPAEDRITPACPYFGVCGGCRLQHLSAAAQIEVKQGALRDHLQRLGKVSAEHYLPAMTDQEWGYRRKARLGVRYVPKKGGVLVGFRERGSSYVTNLDACLVLDPQISQRLPALSAARARAVMSPAIWAPAMDRSSLKITPSNLNRRRNTCSSQN